MRKLPWYWSLILWIVVLILLFLLRWSMIGAKTYTFEFSRHPCDQVEPTLQQVKECLVSIAKEYDLNVYRFIETARGESSFNINAVGDSGDAIGVFQFHENTWIEFVRRYKDYLPQNFVNNRYNWKSQILLAAVSWYVDEELAAQHWTAWRTLASK